MKTPQIIYLALSALEIACAGYLHGKPKTGEYNIGITLLNTMLTLGLLAWGGFFG